MKKRRGMRGFWLGLGREGRWLASLTGAALVVHGLPGAGAMAVLFAAAKALGLRWGGWLAFALMGLYPLYTGLKPGFAPGLVLAGSSVVLWLCGKGRLGSAAGLSIVCVVVSSMAPAIDRLPSTELVSIARGLVVFLIGFAMYPTVRGWGEIPYGLKWGAGLGLCSALAALLGSTNGLVLLAICPAALLWLVYVLERFVRLRFHFRRPVPASGLVVLEEWREAL